MSANINMTNNSQPIKVIAITGPTATGKTSLAVNVAKEVNGEIISVDSRQVYCNMDIGTGKDLKEYGEIKYHLIDIANPAVDTYDLATFCKDAYKAIEDINNRNKVPILCGGTALYLLALLANYRLPDNKEAASMGNTQEANYSFNPPFPIEVLTLGVLYPRKEVRKRIQLRLDARLEEGLIEELKFLHEEKNLSFERLEFFGLEYREVAKYLRGDVSKEEMREELLNKIRQFAKRQDIFFRKIEKEGHDIYWLERGNLEKALSLINLFLTNQTLPEVTWRLLDHKNPPSF